MPVFFINDVELTVRQPKSAPETKKKVETAKVDDGASPAAEDIGEIITGVLKKQKNRHRDVTEVIGNSGNVRDALSRMLEKATMQGCEALVIHLDAGDPIAVGLQANFDNFVALTRAELEKDGTEGEALEAAMAAMPRLEFNQPADADDVDEKVKAAA